jgi:hypothetical protein
MDEIEKRLRETSDHCFKSYDDWRKDQKNTATRAALQDAVHELRKVASRLEIELAVSDRNEMTQKPIPIPPHRDAKHRGGNDGEFESQRFDSDNDDKDFNNAQGHSQTQSQHRGGGGGGGGSGGGLKRRVHRREGGGGGGNQG